VQIEQYIENAGQHWTLILGKGKFWVLHLDTIIVSVLIAVVIVIATALIARQNSSGKIQPLQNAIEYYYEWIEEKVIRSYGKADLWLISVAFTVFLWVLSMSFMDALPSSSLNFLRALTHKNLSFKIVATEDLNMTLALGAASLIITNIFAIANYGALGFIKHVIFQPFGTWAVPINILYYFIEQLTRSFCMALRLFANMLSGGLIFLVLAIFPAAVQIPLVFLWSVVHTGVLCIQALLFTELTIVYINPETKKEFKK